MASVSMNAKAAVKEAILFFVLVHSVPLPA